MLALFSGSDVGESSGRDAAKVVWQVALAVKLAAELNSLATAACKLRFWRGIGLVAAVMVAAVVAALAAVALAQALLVVAKVARGGDPGGVRWQQSWERQLGTTLSMI